MAIVELKENEFQLWLRSQGYTRENKSRSWEINGAICTGAELHLKLKEYSKL